MQAAIRATRTGGPTRSVANGPVWIWAPSRQRSRGGLAVKHGRLDSGGLWARGKQMTPSTASPSGQQLFNEARDRRCPGCHLRSGRGARCSFIPPRTTVRGRSDDLESFRGGPEIWSLNWENVELWGFEPQTSCMPYKSGQSPDVAGSGPASSLSRSTSPVIARYCRSLAPRLAPPWLLVTFRQRPTAPSGGPAHVGSSPPAATCAHGAQAPRSLAAHELSGDDLRMPGHRHCVTKTQGRRTYWPARPGPAGSKHAMADPGLPRLPHK
jgi:hypothetical protein